MTRRQVGCVDSISISCFYFLEGNFHPGQNNTLFVLKIWKKYIFYPQIICFHVFLFITFLKKKKKTSKSGASL